MRQSIRGFTDGIIGLTAAKDLANTAAELAAVRDLLGASDDLRRTLLDPGVPVASRRAVITDLLGSRVSKSTLDLLAFTVEADRATEFVDNVAWLTSRVEAAAQDKHPVSDVVLGQKAAEERADGYASALLRGHAAESDRATLSRIEDELFGFLRVLDSNEEANQQLRAALTDRDLPAEQRTKLVIDLLKDKTHAVTALLATYATQVGRPRDYETLLQHIIVRVAAESDSRLADVRSAVDMSEEQRSHLAAALGRVVGHDVQIRVTVDPSVLAGFVATIGDTVVDGSARRRLEVLKDRLVMPEVKVTTGDPN